MSLTQLVRETSAVLSSEPAKAKATFAAESELVGATEVSAKVGSGHRFTSQLTNRRAWAAGTKPRTPSNMPSPRSARVKRSPTGSGPPSSACSSTKSRWKSTATLILRGFFGVDDRVRAGFNAVRIRVALSGPEIATCYQELAAAVDVHCPVLDLFRNPVPVDRALVSTA